MKLFLEFERLRELNSGLGQVCWRLGQSLARLLPSETSVFCWAPKKQDGLFGQQFQYIVVQYSGIKKFFVLRKKYDVWHCLHQDSKFLPLNSHSKLILTVHDLNFLSEHHLNDEKICARLGRLQRKIDRADIIVTISHYTKKVLEENLNVKNKRVEVIYNGCSMSEQSEPEMPSFAPAGDFLFSIGSIASRKNLHVLLPLMQKLPGISLVMAGSYAAEGDYYRALQQQIRDLNLADRVMMPGAISEAEKVWLYQRCCGLVFPSLLEGFGLPIVEAMYFGQPVFLSTSTSLPEVGGDAAYYWENFDADSMAQVVRQGLTCHNAARVALCKKQAAKFSWQNAAQKYMQLYRDL